MQRRHSVFAWFVLCVLLGYSVGAAAQVNTATLSGTVTDPQGLAVKGAKVTLTSPSTGAERTAITDDNGRYNVVGLPPGKYKMTVDGGAGFAVYENASVVLTVGENGSFDPRLDLKGVQQTVTITTETAPIETTKTETSETVTQRRIDSLPINGRNYINFTLTNSQTTRDMSPTIGPAPNSGLNIGGARARGTAVSVDGVDFVDNSVNGIRSTLSQEGVQEFQLILSNYNAEYGRASGGVINIVSKSGGNEFHGNLFGYFRNKSFQARNAFSGQVDQATGALDPVKQAYTRVQTGATLGGPLKKDKTFIFGSYEYTQREETGFSSIGAGNFGMQTFSIPTPGGNVPVQLTQDQGNAVNALLAAAAATNNPQLARLAVGYGLVMGSASSVALNRLDFGAVANGFYQQHGIPLMASPGAQFPIPVPCPAGQPMNNSATCSQFGVYVAPLPASYVALSTIRGNFPVMEKTSLWSARLDQRWDNRNSSFLRVGVSPSLVTGIEPATQNAVFGENAGSRAGLSQTRDLNFTFQHDTIVSDKAFNEFRMQVSRRGIHFGFSTLPGGDQVAVNIPGTAFFGREPYSPVDRIERRFQFADQVSVVRGNHSFKMGGDFNLVQLRSKKSQIFQLDFGGDITFGGLPASAFVGTNCVGGSGANCAGGIALPGTTGLQSYGLGIPSEFIQGIGTSNAPFDNIPISLFWQDNWRVNRKLALNYGVRYDVEISPLFAPATPLNAAAEKALGVIEGIPRDTNNVAPRIGLAWDPAGDGKTVVRAGYGLFYDHPLLAVAFDATTADGGRSVQLLSPLGLPSACGLIPNANLGIPSVCGPGLDLPTNLNPASIFQGVLNANSIYPALPTSVTLAYEPDQQRFNPFAPNSLFANQSYLTAGFPLALLPFTLPVRSNFVYGYAEQVNASVEREIAGSWRISVGGQRTRGLHLNKPVDINFTDPQLLAQNAANAGAAGLSVPSPILVVAPSSSFGATSTTCGVNVIAPSVLGQLTGCPGPLAPLTGQYVSTPAFFNYFRRSGPNPSFAGLVAPGQPLAVGYATQLFFARLAGYPTGFGGVPVPFNSVDAQTSEGNSWYNALTVNVAKRFTKGFELLSSYTWSHSIDDSTDLQSTLEPQDSRFPFLERSNSDNDQRHRWVTSAVIQSAASKSGDSFFRQFIGNFTLSPLVELASGRPYNIITDVDTRLSLAPGQARPSIITGSTGTTSKFIPGMTFGVANLCLTNSGSVFSIPGLTTIGQGCDGNLARNRFVLPKFFQWDLRVAKRIPFGERVKMDLIADGFNLFNRTNISAVNQVCDPSAGPTCAAGQPTAAYDARQFQFAVKMSW